MATARRLLGQPSVRWPGQTLPDDCSGLVLGVYASVGVPLTGSARPGDNGVTAVWRWTSARGRLFRTGRPNPGDLVFFHDTYDRDHDGKLDDGLTHIALVESVDADGTVSIIHRVSRGVMRYRMNLDRPTLRNEPATGRVLNDWLRGSSGTGKAGTHRTALRGLRRRPPARARWRPLTAAGPHPSTAGRRHLIRPRRSPRR